MSYTYDDAFTGEIRLFAGTFAPECWAFCHGQTLEIHKAQALYSIIGTIYGGDGRKTFALPDLRDVAAIGAGQGIGLQYRELGHSTGFKEKEVSEKNIPPHNHHFLASKDPATTNTPSAGLTLASATATSGPPARRGMNMYRREHADTPLNGDAIEPAGGGREPAKFDNHQPSLMMHYIICLDGLYPSRS